MKFEDFKIGELYEYNAKATVREKLFFPLLLLQKDHGSLVRPQQLLFFDLYQCKKRWMNCDFVFYDLFTLIKADDND